MPTSGSSNYSQTRDEIIASALRKCQAISEGEIASAAAVTGAAEALNDLVKALEAEGMPLWKIKEQGPFTFTATQTYTIGSAAAASFVAPAPLKILQAWTRDTSVTPNTDQPMLLVTDQDYNFNSPKTSTGRPNQLRYSVPGGGADASAGTQAQGIITVYQKPDSYTITNRKLYIVSQLPFEDFDGATDTPDFPQYWYAALKWLLASEIMSEYGLGLPERGWIEKRAEREKEKALSFGVEEGSLYLRPTVQYESPGGSSY